VHAALRADQLDKITLTDGRSFVGEIIEETDEMLTMEVQFGRISAKKTWRKSEIIEIQHDVIDVLPTVEESSASVLKPGLARPDPNDPRPVVYTIPLKGLIGWDLYPPLVEEMWDEAVEVGADIVIFEFDCHEGHYDLEEIRDMIQDFKAEAIEHEIRLIAWVKEARGTAVAYVLMFKEIIFSPDGYMGEGHQLDELLKEMWSDDDVRAKMISAWVGICRGMAIDGDHDAVLCEAMIRPELTLSVDFEGEEPNFYSNSTNPNYEVVDSSVDTALRLTADEANRFGVTPHRSARDVGGIMQRLNIRDYVHYEGKSADTIDKWMEMRERGYEDYYNIRADMQLAGELADDPVRALGAQIRKLKEVVRMLKRCPPHTKAPYGINRVTGDHYGIVSLEQIELEIEALQKEMKAIQEQQRGSGGGSRGTGGGRGKDDGGG
jgi:hypothetical protein